jgi:UPF0271 protein
VRRHVALQIVLLSDICKTATARLRYVKPHGALYNRAAIDQGIADAVADAVSSVDPSLTLLGLVGSEMITAAARFGLPVAREAFLDRAYTPQGRLVPRSVEGSTLIDTKQVLDRAMQLVRDRTVDAIDGSRIHIAADSLCLHGDGPHAIEFAALVREALETNGIDIASFVA